MPTYTLANTRNRPGAGPAARTNGKPSGKSGVEFLEISGMKAEEFDARFDAGEDMSEFLDFSTARRPNREKQKIELDLPFWIIRKLEAEAQKEGVSTQTFLENYLARHIASAP
jgi:hypothetical protein